MINLWLDDVRPAPDGWAWAKSYREALVLLTANDVDKMSLDHDLGMCQTCQTDECWTPQAGESVGHCECICHLTGYNFVFYMELNDRWPAQKPTVHSSNPAGKNRMEAAINKRFGF